MTINELCAELAEAPTADDLIDGDFWDGVFEEIDDPEELREVLKKMERNDDVPLVCVSGENAKALEFSGVEALRNTYHPSAEIAC